MEVQNLDHRWSRILQLTGMLLAVFILVLVQIIPPSSTIAAYLRIALAIIVVWETVLEILKAPWRLNWLRQHALSLTLLLLYAAYVLLIFFNSSWYNDWGRRFPAVGLIVLRNFFLYFQVIPRARRLNELLQNISLHPAQTLVLSFLMIIIIGAFLLMIPRATVDGRGLSLVDALFTATSAVCVTGLIVVDTATHFTLYGKIVILLLIQAGGLGIMLLSYSASWVLTRKLNLRDKLNISYMTNEDDLNQVSRSMLRIIGLTFAFEFIGMILLFIGFLLEGFAPGTALWYGLFHSISAFCNAGFALFSDSFEQFRGSFMLNSVLSALILLGGISFAVIINLGAIAGFGKKDRELRGWKKLTLNSRVVLSTTGILLLLSTLLMYFTEHGNTLAGDSLGVQYLASFFQAVTLRTAGFNTVNFGAMSAAAVWISIMFMIIGGASGSTAGGIKVNTIAVIFAYLRSRIRGQNRVLLFNYALTRNAASNALVLFVFAVFAVGGGFFLLLLSENGDFSDIMFEAVSAFGTVGVSRGITASLSVLGRFIIISLMFMGRLGPLTLLTALADRDSESDVIYPEQEILIG